ncbi:vomeronasal type-2 receptor 26-like [Anomaloglossus baeobatrachus]|uniref:vomeronasal type-2 receptor 26-like n=1 Tax=Anomaloglossus baeobatrachus TaxID=238106 RepID=UPI003F4F6D33
MASFNFRNYQSLLTFVFAINEINASEELLPNITLGFHILDNCFSEEKAVSGMIGILSSNSYSVPNYQCGPLSSLVGFVDGISSKVSLLIARVFGIYKIPQISYSSMDPVLSDKVQFPSFYRTVPSDIFQCEAILKLLNYFGWSWVGILSSNTESGLQMSQCLHEKFIKQNSCFAFMGFIPSHDTKDEKWEMWVVNTLTHTNANVVIVYGDWDYIFTIQVIFYKFKIPRKVWIIATQWDIYSEFGHSFLNFQSFNGSLSLSLYKEAITGFEEFVYSVNPDVYPNDVYIKSIWFELFGCVWSGRWNRCLGNETIKNSNYVDTFRDISFYSYNLYNAVYTLANALSSIFRKENPSTIHRSLPKKIHQHLKKIHFNNSMGNEVSLNDSGNTHAKFHILNWVINLEEKLSGSTVGRFYMTSSDYTLSVNEHQITWDPYFNKTPQSTCSENCPPGFRKSARKELSICCYECISCLDGEISDKPDMDTCLKCPADMWSNLMKDNCVPKLVTYLSYEDTLGASLATLSLLLLFLTCWITTIFRKYRKTAIVKANNRDLSFILLISLKMCFLCALIFIGYPTQLTCVLRHAVFGVSFSVCISSILAKTITVIIAFNATKPGSKLKKWMKPSVYKFFVLSCSIFQVLICIFWLTLAPPFPYNNMSDELGKIIVECREGSPVALYFVLGYLGFLALISFIISFFAKNLPDKFNEAKLITFSMLVFCSVWIAFIPAYLSSKGKYVVAVEIFAILASTAGLLACIFIPKCYILLFKPEWITKSLLIKGTEKNTKIELNDNQN